MPPDQDRKPLPDPSGDSALPHRIAAGFLIATVVVNLWLVTRYWNESILDAHEFRQVQTATTAYFIKRDGFRLAYETPLLGPPWSIPMEFPTYQALVAAVSGGTGIPLEQAGRLVSILFFYACLPAVWLLLARWGLSRTVRLCALSAWLTCPLYAFYTRTVMIESCALCFSLWFVWASWRTLDRPSIARVVSASAVGVLAALTKITTFAIFCLPTAFLAAAATFAWSQKRPRIRSWRTGLTAAVALGVPLLCGVVWVRYSDHLKSLNPYADFLTSSRLHEWNWGTLPQRLKKEFWSAIYAVTSKDVLAEPAGLLLLGLLPGLARPLRWRVLACLLLYLSGCLTFANLYFVHDYYSYATAGFLATAFGIAAGSLIDERRLPPAAAATLVGLALGAQLLAFSRGYGMFYTRPNAPPPPFAEIVRRTTFPDDILVAFGLDWNGVIPYYAERHALMVPDYRVGDRETFKRSVAGFGRRSPGALIIAGNLRFAAEFVNPKLRELGMESFPIASADTMDLYLRSDLHERARHDLRGNHYPGVVFQLDRKSVQDPLVGEKPLTGPEWAGLFSMTSPAPFAYRSQFNLVVNEREGEMIIRTHAPMELLFHPPPGARHVTATGAMVPDAYRDGNTTDGVILQVFEESPDGRRHLLTERELQPMTRPADRPEVTLRQDNERPYSGTIVLRVDPGPLGSVNCDWGYWKQIRID